MSEISIHALLAESDGLSYFYIIKITISIHALLAESDGAVFVLQCILGDFYPRSPCGERRNKKSDHLLPTSNFYPRSPCGERQ